MADQPAKGKRGHRKFVPQTPPASSAPVAQTPANPAPQPLATAPVVAVKEPEKAPATPVAPEKQG